MNNPKMSMSDLQKPSRQITNEWRGSVTSTTICTSARTIYSPGAGWLPASSTASSRGIRGSSTRRTRGRLERQMPDHETTEWPDSEWETCHIGSCARHERCMYVPCRNIARPKLLLTRKQILDFRPFHGAVIEGSMDPHFYSELCGMALAYLDTIDRPDRSAGR